MRRQRTAPSGGMSGQMGGGMTAATGAIDSTATYDTAQSYIDALNANEAWVVYDAAANTAKITGMAPFIAACKTPTKSVCAFDGLDRGQAENNLFGNETDESLHFDATIARLLADNAADYSGLSGYDASYASAYADDIKKTNDLGDDVPTRVDLYNPMYFLNGSYSGFGNSTVAPHWRIRTGINQGDTALTVETNLALALRQLPAVKDVDFATVWGLGHTPAERTGSAAGNFIAWVEECC